ncbi:MAG: type II toxin-antitoxin system VapC family toxin, partial [Acidimicrobiales bacterium]
MSYLLDTHVVLWWLADDHRLSAAVRGLLEDGTQQVAVSAISAWEISIKKALGELDAPDNLSQVLNDSGFSTLAFGVDHATVAGSLPPEHSDPFDR